MYLVMLRFLFYRSAKNGNCQYSSCTFLLYGAEKLCHFFRALVSVELRRNSYFYIDHTYFNTKKIQKNYGYIFGCIFAQGN